MQSKMCSVVLFTETAGTLKPRSKVPGGDAAEDSIEIVAAQREEDS